MPHQSNQTQKIIFRCAEKQSYQPLDKLELAPVPGAVLFVYDAAGNEYVKLQADKDCSFQFGGFLGFHQLLLKDAQGNILDKKKAKVEAKTEILDKKGEFGRMLDMLHFSVRKGYGSGRYFRIKGDLHYTFAGWFQDHAYVQKAMKFFQKDVKSGIDLWAKGQREDGMLADNCYHELSEYPSWLNRFGERFVWKLGADEDSSTFCVKIPVENMSEFTFLEAVYHSWKASGDDAWMAGKIQNCLKAISYATTDEYRWSQKYQLLKRAYTIDIWDFQPIQDIEVWEGDIMMAKPGVTHYSIMYGDNIGFAAGCKYVSEMLSYLGRNQEAREIAQLAEDIMRRLDEISWNGEFYTHHIPEDNYQRDFGDTKVEEQVTISTAYALNRRIPQDKAVSLIKKYQKIKEEMPASSPGEWYLCYPPYEKGWHVPKWEYMNGGVSSMVAGELANGAFWHGFEDYGVDILRRTAKIARELSGNMMKCIYRGAMPEDPRRNFIPLSIAEIANADLKSHSQDGSVPGFFGEADNDLREFPCGRQVFEDVPFDIVDSRENSGRSCLVMANEGNNDAFAQKAVLSVNQKAESLYFLHLYAEVYAQNSLIGEMLIAYQDGTSHREYIVQDQQVGGMWYPQDNITKRKKIHYKVAWEGKNPMCCHIGAYIWGVNNPFPEKVIQSVEFNKSQMPGKWIVLGVSLSDYPVYFRPSPVSYGAPDNWGASSLMCALLEGLTGIRDKGKAFNKARLAPRWELAGEEQARVCLKYEASEGYLCYEYKKTKNILRLDLTGTMEDTLVELYIPAEKTVSKISVNGKQKEFSLEEIQNSRYAVFSLKGIGLFKIEMQVK